MKHPKNWNVTVAARGIVRRVFTGVNLLYINQSLEVSVIHIMTGKLCRLALQDPCNG